VCCAPTPRALSPAPRPLPPLLSSRFGKFLKLYFDKSAKIKGASLATYLLEKSRVTHIGQGERAYHIFYQVLRGMSASQLKELHLPSEKVTEYKYAQAARARTREDGGGRRTAFAPTRVHTPRRESVSPRTDLPPLLPPRASGTSATATPTQVSTI